jgi:uncharacterized protein (TIGR03382 family)
MKPTCLRMESMQMPVTHAKAGACDSAGWPIWLALPLLMFAALFTTICHAQDGIDPACGHSTVVDAWGQEAGVRAQSFLAELKHIVKANDKAAFAALVRYPIQVSVGAKSSDILTSSSFIRRYRSIVTPALRQVILAQDPKCLFANGQGVMIGHGQVWFQQEGRTAKIISITLESPEAH